MKALMVMGLSAWVLGAAPAGAEPDGGTAHGHGGGSRQGHIEAQQCAERFDAVVKAGRGFGMAFAADQNGYPGPLHVLELREALQLTADQEARARALLDAMYTESRPKGRALIEAEDRLRASFQSKRATEGSVRAQVAKIERLRGDLRLVHLLFHLRARDLLTEQQLTTYRAVRWPERPPGR